MNLSIHIFEVDLPHVLKYKNEILKKYTPTSQRHCVESDLADKEAIWKKQLIQHGFNPNKPSLWILEGLIMYLNESDVHKLLDHIKSLTCDGSRIVIHSMNSAYIKSNEKKVDRDLFQNKFQAPMRFGTDDPEGLIKKYGFIKNVKSADYSKIGKELGIEKRLENSKGSSIIVFGEKLSFQL